MYNRIVIPNKGWFYRNEFWFSEAYKDLNIASRDLLQCFLTEIRRGKAKVRNRKNWIILNNGKISFTSKQFKDLTGFQKQTYINARNQLINNGIIVQTYRGGNNRGDMAKYKLLCTEDVKREYQRWRLYPTKNWIHDIPKVNPNRVGFKTQWKKGQSGRTSKTTLVE